MDALTTRKKTPMNVSTATWRRRVVHRHLHSEQHHTHFHWLGSARDIAPYPSTYLMILQEFYRSITRIYPGCQQHCTVLRSLWHVPSFSFFLGILQPMWILWCLKLTLQYDAVALHILLKIENAGFGIYNLQKRNISKRTWKNIEKNPWFYIFHKKYPKEVN